MGSVSRESLLDKGSIWDGGGLKGSVSGVKLWDEDSEEFLISSDISAWVNFPFEGRMSLLCISM